MKKIQALFLGTLAAGIAFPCFAQEASVLCQTSHKIDALLPSGTVTTTSVTVSAQPNLDACFKQANLTFPKDARAGHYIVGVKAQTSELSNQQVITLMKQVVCEATIGPDGKTRYGRCIANRSAQAQDPKAKKYTLDF
jgi:hypothetical protein